jgi:hypothetical protein
MPSGRRNTIRRPVQAEDLYHIVQSTIENTPRENIRIHTRLPVMVKTSRSTAVGKVMRDRAFPARHVCPTLAVSGGLKAFSADRR